MKRTIKTDEAPAVVGTYSQATTNDSLLYTVGQIPLTPGGGFPDDEDITAQITQSLDSVMTILAEAGVGATDVLETTVFPTDIDNFDEMSETYTIYLDEESSARSAVEVDNLPRGVGAEIGAIVIVDEE